MKRKSKINDNEYNREDVEYYSTLITEIIEGIIYLILLGVLAYFVINWL